MKNIKIYSFFILILSLLFILKSSVALEYIGSLTKDEYAIVNSNIEKFVDLVEFDKTPENEYDFCLSQYFTCRDGQVTQIQISNINGKSIIDSTESFSGFKNLEKVTLSLFELENININSPEVTLESCIIKEFILNSNIKTLTIDYNNNNGDLQLDISKLKNVKNFILKSSKPFNTENKIKFLYDNKDEVEVDNWDIISTDFPPFNENFKANFLKLRILENPTDFLNSKAQITNLELTQNGLDGIDFPKEYLEGNKNLRYFGTDFKFKSVTDQINIGPSMLTNLQIVNAAGFSCTQEKKYNFPFSNLPSGLTSFTFTGNDEEYDLPLKIIKKSDKITELILPYNRFTHYITENEDFNAIVTLDLSNNLLTGRIGDWVTKMKSLKLNNNILSGPIPVELLCYSSFIDSIKEGNLFLNSRNCEDSILQNLKVEKQKPSSEGGNFTYQLAGYGLKFNDEIRFKSNPSGNWKIEGKGYSMQSPEEIDYFTFTFPSAQQVSPLVIPVIGIDLPIVIDNIQIKGNGSKDLYLQFTSGLGLREISVKFFTDKSLKTSFGCLPTFTNGTGFSVTCLLEDIKQSKFFKVSSKFGNSKLIEFDYETLGTNRVIFTCNTKSDSCIYGCDFTTGLCKCENDCHIDKYSPINSHGVCTILDQSYSDSKCNCTTKWSGQNGTKLIEDCSIANCDFLNCKNGKCDPTNGICKCDDQHTGPNCDIDKINGAPEIEGSNAPYFISVIFFILLIIVSFIIYKKYMANGSNDSGNDIKFKTLRSTNDGDDEEGNISIKKSFKDEE